MAKRTIGNLAVVLSLDTSRFSRAIRGVQAGLGRIGGLVRGVAGRFMGLQSAILAAVGVGTLGYAIRQQMKFIDTIAKTSDRLRVTTQDLVAMGHAATLAGVNQEGLSKGLERFQRSLGEAKQGLTTPLRSLETLGLTLEDLEGMALPDQLALVAQRLAQVKDPTDRVTAAYGLLGRQGQQLQNFLAALASGGMEAVREEAEKLGIAFNRVDAAKVEAANDAITRLQASAGGLFQRVAVALAPAIEAVASLVGDLTSRIDTTGLAAVNTARVATDAIVSVADSFRWVLDAIAVTKIAVLELQKVFAKTMNIAPRVPSGIARGIERFAETGSLSKAAASGAADMAINIKPGELDSLDAQIKGIEAEIERVSLGIFDREQMRNNLAATFDNLVIEIGNRANAVGDEAANNIKDSMFTLLDEIEDEHEDMDQRLHDKRLELIRKEAEERERLTRGFEANSGVTQGGELGYWLRQIARNTSYQVI